MSWQTGHPMTTGTYGVSSKDEEELPDRPKIYSRWDGEKWCLSKRDRQEASLQSRRSIYNYTFRWWREEHAPSIGASGVAPAKRRKTRVLLIN